jgi:hypothetical protein
MLAFNFGGRSGWVSGRSLLVNATLLTLTPSPATQPDTSAAGIGRVLEG